MIIDSLQNIDKYVLLHPLFKKAFEYIKATKISKIAIGKYELGEGLIAIFSDKNGVEQKVSTDKFECHNKNIDIQICINGVEKMGWKPRQSCTKPNGAYNEEKDVMFYADEPDMFFTLHTGQFAIFFPEDVHAPMINVDDKKIKKLVLKVKQSVC